MNRRTASFVASLVGLSLLTTTVPSIAQTKGKPSPTATNKKKPLNKKDPKYIEAKRLFEQGEEQFAKGNYKQAIESWELSYDLMNADLIFDSIASAYERLGDVDKAREYLARWREAAPEAEHADLDSRLANLDRRIAAAKAEREAKEKKEKADKEARDKREAEDRAKQGKLFIPGIVIAGVGGAAAIGGGVLDFLAYRRRPDESAVCATSPGGNLLCRESSRTAIETSNKMALAGDILLFGGAAIAATGVVLVVLKSGGKKDEAKTAALPWVLPGGGGLLVGGKF
jgi:tetratricopeptide (TPR) repeat protein